MEEVLDFLQVRADGLGFGFAAKQVHLFVVVGAGTQHSRRKLIEPDLLDALGGKVALVVSVELACQRVIIHFVSMAWRGRVHKVDHQQDAYQPDAHAYHRGQRPCDEAKKSEWFYHVPCPFMGFWPWNMIS